MRPLGVALLWVAAAQAQSIHVRVVDGLTGSPLQGASITAMATQPSSDVIRTAALPGVVRAAANGEADVPTGSPGAHFVKVEVPGYVQDNAGFLGAEAAEGTKELLVRMLPLGVLTGRVVDQYGDPLRMALVTVGQVGGYTGKAQKVRTDDQGLFRAARLDAGRYAVQIRYSAREIDQAEQRREVIQWAEVGGRSAEMETAVPVGQVVPLGEIRVNVDPAVTISGRITNPGAGRGSAVLTEMDDPESDVNLSVAQELRADGTFRITALRGMYRLRFETPNKLSSRVLLVDASAGDVSGIEVRLGEGYVISGRVHLEGKRELARPKLSVQLHQTGALEVDAAGAFTGNIPTDHADFQVPELHGGWYLRRATLDGAELKSHGLNLHEGTNFLELWLSSDGAELDVTSEDSSQAAMTLLVPDGEPLDPDKVIGSGGKQGKDDVSVEGIPPGKYRVLLFDFNGLGVFLHPEVANKYLSKAPVVTFAEGEHKSMRLPVIRIAAGN